MLLFTIDTWLVTHSFAMSEALLITVVLAWRLVMARHLSGGSGATLGWVATLAAAAVLTRWVGFSVGAAGVALMLGRVGWPRRVRVAHAAVVLGAAVLAGGAWSLYGRIAGGSDPRLPRGPRPGRLPRLAPAGGDRLVRTHVVGSGSFSVSRSRSASPSPCCALHALAPNGRAKPPPSASGYLPYRWCVRGELRDRRVRLADVP